MWFKISQRNLKTSSLTTEELSTTFFIVGIFFVLVEDWELKQMIQGNSLFGRFFVKSIFEFFLWNFKLTLNYYDSSQCRWSSDFDFHYMEKWLFLSQIFVQNWDTVVGLFFKFTILQSFLLIHHHYYLYIIWWDMRNLVPKSSQYLIINCIESPQSKNFAVGLLRGQSSTYYIIVNFITAIIIQGL